MDADNESPNECFDTLLTSFVKWTDELSSITMIGFFGGFKTNSMYFFSKVYRFKIYTYYSLNLASFKAKENLP